jgi:hypothetical protein
MSRPSFRAKGSAAAALVLWLGVAGVSLGYSDAKALAEESGAAEATVEDPDQQPGAPTVAEREAPEAPEADSPAGPSSERRRSRIIKPDFSDLDAPVWDSGPRRQKVLSAQGAAEGGIVCVAGCSGISGSAVPATVGTAAPTIGPLVCIAGC